MTTKEAEHWLIEQGCRYDPDTTSWEVPGTTIAVLDAFVTEHPATAIEWVRNELKAAGRKVS